MRPLRMMAASALVGLAFSPQSVHSADISTLQPARPIQCAETRASCDHFDAVVFVHGIYGSNETFKNSTTGFDWPSEFPKQIDTAEGLPQPIDVYVLAYQTSMLSWAKGSNPSFEDLARSVDFAMWPLRKRHYRSIGFVAHSLGGNVVSTYLHQVTSSSNHPVRSQHGYVITLATPVLGSQIADIAIALKKTLFMRPELLSSLKSENLYTSMLNDFRMREQGKAALYGCRAVNLHAAVEEKHIGPLLVVRKDSAAQSISEMVSSPVVGFPLNHIQISKPTGPQDDVYKWVLSRVESELDRMAAWDKTHQQSDPKFRLCEQVPFISDGPGPAPPDSQSILRQRKKPT